MNDLLNDPSKWGRKLITTNDHDPLYAGLVSWDVGDERLMRYMLAYWCCYSVGASWFISKFEGQKFWTWLQTAALNETGPDKLGACDMERWPRAPERRHWRGQKCVDSVLWLREQFPRPEDAVAVLSDARTLGALEQQITDWPLFGPWIAFKAADMLERILGQQITFTNDIITLYRDPKKGAEMAAEVWGYDTPQMAAERLLAELSDLRVCGNEDRQVNIQEVETVLCKWKSARRGHYAIGHDTRDHRAELAKWGAQDLLGNYPTGAA